MQVFVSFTGNDRDMKNKIVLALRNELGDEHEVFESDEGCASDFSEESISQIKRSEVFVILLSASSMAMTSSVINELIAAHDCEKQGKLNMVAFKLDDAPMPERFQFQMNHISDANHTYHGEDGIPSLVRKVRRLLERRRLGVPEKPMDIDVPELNGIPIGKTGYFVEHSRDQELKAIEDALDANSFVFCIQLEGYGRRTAVRRYIEKHADSYTNSLYFPQFSGSLWEFLLKGLSIENLDPCVYDKLDEMDIVRKKLKYLGNLGRDTLLMVPNVYLDDRDYQPVFDMLGALSCRVIFVTQSMPQRYRDAVSQVRVGRMSDENLEKLFFHHYEHADEAQQSALKPALRSFFAAIDGHTKTIELAAHVLSDEYLTPEELDTELSHLGGAEHDELSDRVFDSVVQLFDISGFDETDKKLLLAAALLCELPLSEREFVALLKQAGLFSGTSLKKLCDSRWIDKDEQGKLLSMSALLANVCLKRLPMSGGVPEACLAYLLNALGDDLLDKKLQVLRMDYLRLSRIWQVLDRPASARLANLCLSAWERSDANALPGDWEQTYALAQSEQQALADEERETGLQLVENLRIMIESQHIMELMPLDARGRGVDEAFTAKLLDLFAAHDREGFLSLFEELNDQEDMELRELGQGVKHLMSSTSPGMLMRVFLSLCDKLTRSIPEYGKEYDLDFFAYILYQLGMAILVPFFNTAYGRLTLLRRLEALLDARGGAFTEVDAYLISARKLVALSEAGDAAEKLDEAYTEAWKRFLTVRESFYRTPEEACEDFFGISDSYIAALTRGGRPLDAAEALRGCRALDVWSARRLLRYTQLLSEVTEAMFEAGLRQQGVDSLRELLPWIRSSAASLREDGNNLEDALSLAQELQDELESMEDPGIAASAGTVYRDYYDVFPSGRGDAKRAKLYAALAQGAAAFDLKAESDEQLRSRLEALKRRARAGELWKTLAVEAFALFSEACRRVLGYPLHGVQLTGAAVVFDSGVAEMQNGEGKTCVIALAAFLHALYGRQVHILDTSRYLSKRNYVWMRGLLEYLGLRVGFLNEFHNFDESLLDCDVIYGQLRDMLFSTILWKVNGCSYALAPLRKDVALVDEADEGLVAQLTDLTVSGNMHAGGYQKRLLFDAARRTVSQLHANDSEFFTRRRGVVTLKPAIWELAQTYLKTPIASMPPADQALIENALHIAVDVMLFFEKDRDYFIRADQAGDEVPMIETGEGTLSPMSREWAYFVWAREGRIDLLPAFFLADRNELYTASSYRLLKEYRHIGGASATAVSLAEEFQKYYGLDVFRLDPNRACVRTDHPAKLYLTKEYKYEAILELIREKHAAEQPVLVICENVRESKLLGTLLLAQGIENTVLNAANQDENPEALSRAGEKGRVTVTTALANRGVDICLGGDPALRAQNRLIELGVDKTTLLRAISGLQGEDAAQKRLRQRYVDLRAYYWYKLSQAKAEVEALGGLCVIGTTCFNDLRTEQQLRGRSGRQGSPGESWLFYSLDDAPLAKLLGDRLEAIRRLFGDEREDVAIGFLNDRILKARLRLQHARSDSFMQTPGVLYFYDGLEALLKPVPELSDPKRDVMGFIISHLQQDPLYSEEMKLLNEGKLTRANSFVLYLSKQGLHPVERETARDRLTRLKSFLLDFLTRTQEGKEFNAQQNNIFKEPHGRLSLAQNICAELRNACSRYIEAVRAELQASERLGHSRARIQRHMSQYADDLRSRLYNQAVESALLRYCLTEYGSREALG